MLSNAPLRSIAQRGVCILDGYIQTLNFHYLGI